MDWNQIRQQWQGTAESAGTAPDSETLAALQHRDAKLRGQVLRRDRLETIVALLLVPFFAYGAWRAGLRADWLPMFFSLWLTTWVLYVPWHLWRARRRIPQPRPDLALVDYLKRQREAMLVQARMLEQVWVWYLAPCAIGAIGLNFAAKGMTLGNVIYGVIVLAFCLFLGRLNRRAAQTRFRDVAEQIDQQLADLTKEHNA